MCKSAFLNDQKYSLEKRTSFADDENQLDSNNNNFIYVALLKIHKVLHTWGEIKYIQISTHLHRCSVDSSVTTATAGLRLRAIRQIALACDLLSLLTQPERADMCSSSRLSSCLIQWTEPQSAFCYFYLNILSVPFFVAFNIQS